jgi:hypothetical protein
MLPEDQNSQQSSKKELNQVGIGGIKSLRTFQSDVAEALGKNNVTVASIAIAENARKANNEAPIVKEQPIQITQTNTRDTISIPVEKPKPVLTIKPPQVISNNPEPVTHRTRSVLLTFLSLILVAGGIFGGLYFYSRSPLSNITPVLPQKGAYRGILASNTQKKVLLGTLLDKRIEEVLAYERTQAKLEQGQISELYFIKGNQDEPFLITAEEFLSLSTTRSPEAVRRSLLTNFMFGFHRNSISTEPYLVLKTEFFQNTFTGMLKWEPEILADTKVWLSSETSDAKIFEDKVLKNKDIRILRDTNQKIILIYGFLDKETLVITTNEDTFLEIMDRFEKQTYVR